MDTNCYGGWGGITTFAPLALVLFDSGAWPPCLTPLDSALTRTAPPSRVESTLPRHQGSVSKQTALSHLESALTDQLASATKQATSSRSESTLTRFLDLTNLESTLTKMRGRGTRRPTADGIVAQPFLAVFPGPTKSSRASKRHRSPRLHAYTFAPLCSAAAVGPHQVTNHSLPRCTVFQPGTSNGYCLADQCV
jgi:hypothetical protein